MIATNRKARDLTILLTDNYLNDDLRQYNTWAWLKRRPFMLVKPVGRTIWLGPVFRPGLTACWDCLASQLMVNRRGETFLDQHYLRSNRKPTAVASLPVTTDLALQMIALEIIHWLADPEYKRFDNTIITIELPTMKTEKHHVRTMPFCPVCGVPRSTNGAVTNTPQIADEDIHDGWRAQDIRAR